MKKKILFLSILICIFHLTGCNKNDNSLNVNMDEINSYSEEKVIENKTIDTDKYITDDFQLIPNNFTNSYHGLNSRCQVVINANVNIDNYKSQVNVYSVEPCVSDEQYICEMAEKLFDDGQYKIVSPYILMDEVYVDPNEKYYGTVDSEKQVSRILKNDLNDIEFKENQLFYDYFIDNTYLNYELSMNITKDVFRFSRIEGTINDVNYEMSSFKASADEWGYFDFHTPENKDPLYGGLNYGFDNGINIYGENICDYDYAKYKADITVKMLGKYDFVKQYEMHRLIAVENYEKKLVLDGYRFIYTPVFDDIPIDVANDYMAYVDNESLAVCQPMLVIDIDSKGIQKLSMTNDYKSAKKMCTVKKQLSFNQIIEILENYITTKDDIDNSYIAIDTIKYTYILTKSENGYAFVPVWLLSKAPTQICEYPWNWIAINSIDGSIIRFKDDNYEALALF